MPVGRTLVALLLIASVSFAEELPQVRVLQKDKPLAGEVLKITAKEIVVRADGKEVATPADQVLAIDFRAPRKLNEKTTDVQLTDGSLLHCKEVTLKGAEVEADLLAGPKVKMPLDAIGYILKDAQDPKLQQSWKDMLAGKRSSDLLATLRQGELLALKGTFGNADGEGKEIQFDLNSEGKPRSVKLEKIQGLLFYRAPNPQAPPVLCKVTDTVSDLVMASAVNVTASGYTVTTPAGVKIEYPAPLLASLDFSKGKLTYLSDMEPAKVTYSSTEEMPHPYRRDRNLDNTVGLRLARAPGEKKTECPWVAELCPKGLALHAYTSLEYDLGGEYRELTAWVGIDERVGGTKGPTVLRIEGDGKLLYETTVLPDTDPVPLTCNVKDIRRLHITVSSGSLLDLGRHLALADAKVTK